MLTNLLRIIILASLAQGLAVAAASAGDGEPTEWGPIGLRGMVSYSGDGPGGSVGLNIFPGLPRDDGSAAQEEDSEDKSLMAKAAAQEFDGAPRDEHRYAHLIEIDLGHATVETADPDVIRTGVGPRELGVFYLTAGYKIRRQWRLDDPADEPADESWRELRLVGGVGLGAYDFEDVERFGAYARLGGQYAFSVHASRAVELSVAYHRPRSGPSFHEIKLGFAWHLPSRR